MLGPLNFHMNLRISLPSSLGWGDLLEKGKATHSSILAWRVRHNWGAKCLGFPGGSENKVSVCLQCGRPGFDLWVGKIPRRRKWQPTQYSCLEKPMDRGAWWARVHGTTKSWARLSDLACSMYLPICFLMVGSSTVLASIFSSSYSAVFSQEFHLLPWLPLSLVN